MKMYFNVLIFYLPKYVKFILNKVKPKQRTSYWTMVILYTYIIAKSS